MANEDVKFENYWRLSCSSIQNTFCLIKEKIIRRNGFLPLYVMLN